MLPISLKKQFKSRLKNEADQKILIITKPHLGLNLKKRWTGRERHEKRKQIQTCRLRLTEKAKMRVKKEFGNCVR